MINNTKKTNDGIFKKLLKVFNSLFSFTLSIVGVITIVLLLDTYKFKSNKDYFEKNMDAYHNTYMQCLITRSSDFNNDTLTNPDILGRELLKVCKLEINALRGFLIESSGYFIGDYFFYTLHRQIEQLSITSIYKARGNAAKKNTENKKQQ